MPPPKDKPSPVATPSDGFTSAVHSETYPTIDSTRANLKGKNVFICGASRGIGRAIAISFAKAGAESIAIGARSDLTATETATVDAATAAKRKVPNVVQVKLDVTDQKSVTGVVEEIEKAFGRLDIIVHNSGVVGKLALLADGDPDDWWNTWTTNLCGPYLVTRAFLPLLLKGGDKQIVFVSSVGSFLKSPNLSAYQTSKLALLRFAEFVSAEYGDKGVLPFCIHPGNIPGTDILGPGGVPEGMKHIFTDTVELAADTIVYLTKEKREWLAGRYVSCTWDMKELMAKKDEVIKGDKLKVGLVL